MSLIGRMPAEIKKVYRDMSAIAPCIIAGGAVRDTLLGRAVKDIDVFMDSAYKTVFMNSVSAQYWKRLGRSHTEYKLANVVDEVYETSFGYQWPVQVIFCSIDPEEYVTRYFDLGICKAWYDGTRIHCHKDFIKDVNNKTIAMCLDDKTLRRAYPNTAYAIKHIKAHANRIHAKYPSHAVVVPESDDFLQV